MCMLENEEIIPPGLAHKGHSVSLLTCGQEEEEMIYCEHRKFVCFW